jgi:hypothetical protein
MAEVQCATSAFGFCHLHVAAAMFAEILDSYQHLTWLIPKV